MIVVFLSSFAYGTYQIVNDEEFTVAAVVAVLALLIPLITVLTRKSLYVIERRAMLDEIRMKTEKNWESMNPDYSKKKKLLEEIDKKIADLEKTFFLKEIFFLFSFLRSEERSKETFFSFILWRRERIKRHPPPPNLPLYWEA